jgi:integrase
MLAVLEEAKHTACPKDAQRKDRSRGGQVFLHGRHSPTESPDALVFPNSLDKPFDPHNVTRFIRNSLKEPDVTAHGFRSTIRDWMRAETSFDDILWHIQVDHVLGDRTSQAYGHNKLLDQRRSMMELWGEYCAKPAPEPKAGKVFKLSNKRRPA